MLHHSFCIQHGEPRRLFFAGAPRARPGGSFDRPPNVPPSPYDAYRQELDRISQDTSGRGSIMKESTKPIAQLEREWKDAAKAAGVRYTPYKAPRTVTGYNTTPIDVPGLPSMFTGADDIQPVDLKRSDVKRFRLTFKNPNVPLTVFYSADPQYVRGSNKPQGQFTLNPEAMVSTANTFGQFFIANEDPGPDGGIVCILDVYPPPEELPPPKPKPKPKPKPEPKPLEKFDYSNDTFVWTGNPDWQIHWRSFLLHIGITMPQFTQWLKDEYGADGRAKPQLQFQIVKGPGGKPIIHKWRITGCPQQPWMDTVLSKIQGLSVSPLNPDIDLTERTIARAIRQQYRATHPFTPKEKSDNVAKYNRKIADVIGRASRIKSTTPLTKKFMSALAVRGAITVDRDGRIFFSNQLDQVVRQFVQLDPPVDDADRMNAIDDMVGMSRGYEFWHEQWGKKQTLYKNLDPNLYRGKPAAFAAARLLRQLVLDPKVTPRIDKNRRVTVFTVPNAYAAGLDTVKISRPLRVDATSRKYFSNDWRNLIDHLVKTMNTP